ncbi:MAG: FAD:protein FMN transferase [Ruminococcus sp.]|nr:FAD:protein FMN transferase [Ruminococcus sp.]
MFLKFFSFKIIVIPALMISLFSCSMPSEVKNNSSEIFVMDTMCSISTDSKQASAEVSSALKDMNTAFDSCGEKGEAFRLNKKRSAKCSDYLCGLINDSMRLSAAYSDNVEISSGAVTLLWKEAGKSLKLPKQSETKDALASIGDNLICTDGNNISLSDGCKIDTGAFAKGYALDKCKDILDKSKCKSAVISMTSSVLLYGEKSDGSDFNVQIRNPDGNGFLGTVNVKSCFLSTSGGYERFFTIDGKNYCHIIDLSTGYPSESDLTSVTVFCQSGILSDYLSTLIFIGGTKNINRFLSSDDFKVAAFDKNGKSYISRNLDFKAV